MNYDWQWIGANDQLSGISEFRARCIVKARGGIAVQMLKEEPLVMRGPVVPYLAPVAVEVDDVNGALDLYGKNKFSGD